MCTVTYLPVSVHSFILTSNRDEKIIRRVALTPQTNSIGEQIILYPKDTQGGGTWIATTAEKTICLLNGAFKPHQRVDHYKHSRGKVVLAAFEYTSIYDFITHYDFRGIEPFTLVIVENYQLYELRWNGSAGISNLWMQLCLISGRR